MSTSARLRRLLPVLLPLVLFVVTGLRGIDFGYHWDEKEHQLQPAKTMIKTGVLLPGAYIYPSLNRSLALLPVIPDGARVALDRTKSLTDVQSALLTSTDRKNYPFEVRSVFLVTASLSIVWLYLLILAWRNSVAEALLGACLMGFSWEYAYHARWIASDCIVAQFGALTTLLAMQYRLQPRRRLWLYLASGAAGLAAGSKYPGGIFVLSALVAAFQAERKPFSVRRLSARFAQVIACFVGVYLVTTPGTVLDPLRFFNDLKFAKSVYSTGWYGYSVQPGLAHLSRNIGYLAFSFFSHYTVVAVILFAAALFGLYRVVRASASDAAFFVAVPVAYLGYLSFGNGNMIVRNLLLVAVFLAPLAARGLMDLLRFARPRPLQIASAVGIAGLMIVNGAWLIRASETIRRRGRDNYVVQALDYVRAHGADSFVLSKGVLDAAKAAGLELPPNATVTAEGARYAVLYGNAEGPGRKYWRANDPFLTVEVFGPNEVNFSYYPTWRGDDRVIVMKVSKACEAHVPMLKSIGCGDPGAPSGSE